MGPRFKTILLFAVAVIRVESPVGPGHFVSIRGNGAGLSWNEGKRATEVSPGTWELRLETDRAVEVKALLDDKFWLSTEKNVVLRPGETETLHDPNFEVSSHGTVEERKLGGRVIRIYLPPGYKRSSGRKYPVIYMQDGDKLFGTGPQSWRANATADQMIAQGRMPPSVIVGIDPISPGARMSELTPFEGVVHENNEQTVFGKTGGKLFEYAKHVVQEIKPIIDGAFDVLTDRSNTVIGGSSLGGQASLVIAVTYPDVFGDVIGMSGTWFWGEVVRNEHGQVVRNPRIDPAKDIVYEPHFSVAQYVREQLERNRVMGKPMPRVFLSVGDQEWPIMQRSMQVMKTQLQTIGYELDKNLFVHVNPMGRHSEVSWNWTLRVPFTRLLKEKCGDCLLPRK